MNDVKIGKLKISIPSLITAIAGIVAGLAVGYHTKRPAAGLIITAVLFGAAYNVNCNIHGNCVAWAYFLSSVYLFYALLILGLGKKPHIKSF
jgi:hypothetical protein